MFVSYCLCLNEHWKSSLWQTWFVFIFLLIYQCVYTFFFVSPCSSSPLWIHWGSTLTWLLMASRLERQMWSFAPTKMLWRPCPKTRITCVCVFFYILPVLVLTLVTPLLLRITLCSWEENGLFVQKQKNNTNLPIARLWVGHGDVYQ